MSNRTQAPPLSALPPLVDGDRLTREEFERRYDAMPDLKKAELIHGVVCMPSPVRWNQHGAPHASVLGWLWTYAASTPGTQPGDNGSVRMGDDSEPQPDAALIILPSHGGQVRISADDYLEGGPELIVEVSASTARLDLTEKLRLYEQAGVREYVVWRVPEQRLDWFVLRNGAFVPATPDADGCLRSETFPGLWLDSAALVREDLAAVLATLHRGMATPEHADFVARLRRRAGGP